MHVHVVSSVNEASSEQLQHRTTIVIDVLRATSTIIAALAAGAAGVVPVETVMEARALQREGDLLGGERFCRRIPGFELGNSPSEYTKELVLGRRILLTTTNGTRAIHKSLRSDHVLAGSLLNAEACAKSALELRRDIVLLCSGSHDEFAIEDGLCAGLLLNHLTRLSSSSIDTDDFGTAMLSLYRHQAASLLSTLLQGATGKRLVKLGLRRDVEVCAAADTCSVVPRLAGDTMICSLT
ncbi:2-phosphosulfolactate phosphatase [Paenibacillus sp. GCM10023252]|uniref:2-phosphosulfolactate phosphatase n=1 Tax=Paenibacillus sp. GCM10023252 TaxID=3252649 RepID=UPI00361955FB